MNPNNPTPATGSSNQHDSDSNGVHVSKPSKKETTREIISTIGVLIAALVVAFGLIAWVFQSYEVDGPSMQTTLQNKDRLIVWKVPRTISRITGHPYIPHRGDIIIFVESGLADFGSSDSKQLIKRVIGLPGDHLTVHNGLITVYSKQYPNGYHPDLQMPYGKVVNEKSDDRDIDITLGPTQLYMCGDNRPNSLDSRTFGPIDASQVIGKLTIRLLPVSNIQTF